VTSAHRLPARAASTAASGVAAKRALDLALTLPLLIVAGPVIVVLWAAVRVTSRGPGFFRQERLGRDGRPFRMLKLRSMHVGRDDAIHRDYVRSLLAGDPAEAAGRDGLYKLAADPRITRLGGWLRKSSLDELPQLINVLRGDMSLVGPRPVLAWEAELFTDRQRRRFAVKPGITGLWQVSGRNRLSMTEALELDVAYTERRGLGLDLLILARTPLALLRGDAR